MSGFHYKGTSITSYSNFYIKLFYLFCFFYHYIFTFGFAIYMFVLFSYNSWTTQLISSFYDNNYVTLNLKNEIIVSYMVFCSLQAAKLRYICF